MERSVVIGSDLLDSEVDGLEKSRPIETNLRQTGAEEIQGDPPRASAR